MCIRDRLWSIYSDESDYQEVPVGCLIVVKISQLPRSASCEWGGITCKDLQDYNDTDSDSDFSLDKVSIQLDSLNLVERINWFETCITSGNDKQYIATTFVNSNDSLLDLLNELAKRPSQVTLYGNPLNVDAILPTFVNVEFYPVEQIYNYKGEEYMYGLHIRY